MKTIKLFLLLWLTLNLTSCLDDDDNHRGTFFYEIVPIEEVEIAEEFTRGQIEDIKVSFFRPTNCHSFYGFDYDRISNERTVSVVNIVFEDQECNGLEDSDLVEVSLEFLPTDEDSYVFRFWQGRNEEGENQYFVVEVPVVD